ncbi:hypothetical protein Tco_0612971 [Tanacetum coccineum]
MAQLKYCDKHNQVGFLCKPDESAGFAEIVDFLRGSNLRYALTTNPTIYDSLVKQFWQTATTNTHRRGQEHAAQAQTQPIPPPPPIPSPTPTPIPPSTSPPQIIQSPTPTPIPTPTSPPPPPETEPPTDEHIYEEQSPVHHHFSPSQAQASSHMPTDDLLQTVPKLISRIDSLELDLKQTKLTMGNAIVKLDKNQGQLTKGKEYKRRKESTGKKVVSSLDFQEDNTGAEKINTAGEVNAASIEVNTASKVNTGSIELNTVIEQDSTAGENKGQREGKALCSVKNSKEDQRNRSYKKTLSLQNNKIGFPYKRRGG